MPPDDLKWGHVKQMELISLLRGHPVLWDRDFPGYSKRNQRKIALEYIAAQMDTTTRRVKSKIHTMRSQYTKEYKLMRTNKNYKPRWKLFDAFRFVFKHDKCEIDSLIGSQGDKISNLEYDDSTDEDFITEEYDTISFHKSDAESIFDEIVVNSESTKKLSDEAVATALQNQQSSDTIPKSTAFSDLSYNVEERDSCFMADSRNLEVQYDRDEFTIFGESVANELRSLRDYQSIQLALKCKILRALLEANEALHRVGWIK